MNKFGCLIIAIALTSCSTVGNSVISDNSLKQKTAVALNSEPENITISNRRSDGLDSIRFTASANGRSHQCYITTLMGAISSDAICSAGNNAKEAKPQKNSGQQCNALLQAAGRC